MQDSAPLRGPKIAVTGSGGFLGRHLLPQLAAARAQITALVRSEKSASQVGALTPEATIVRGDCASLEAMQKAVAGQEVVIHLAALLSGAGWQDYMEANTAYAENLADAVLAAKSVRRVIFVSSLAAAGPSAQAPGKNENERPAPVSAYGWSKLAAERILAARLGPRLVVLRPPIIYGSGDRGLLPLFKSARSGIGVSPGHFPVSLIHAADAAAAILLACRPAASGIYHLSDGETHDMAAICRAMAAAQGRPKVFVAKPPLPLFGLTAAAVTAAFRLYRGLGGSSLKAPAWNWDKYRESRQPGWLADSSRIRREPGFVCRHDLASGMAEAVAGYRREGLL